MPTPPPAHMPEPDRQSASQSIGGRDAGKVSFSGLAEPCAIGSLVEVVINAQGATQGSVLVEAIAPTGKVHRCQVHQRGNTFTATFTPNEVGEWQIAIMYDSEHIRGSPFVCHVYDANLVRVYGLDVGVVGQELKFNVNTSNAGRGDIQVQVSHHGRSIACYLDKQGPNLYRVQFTPDGAGHYKIHVFLNNMEVKGSPFSLDIVDASSVSVYGDNLKMASVDKLATFMIHAVGADSKDLTVTINAPSGKKKRARVVPIGDSTYRVEWKPVEAGEHYIDVRLYNQSVQDGPFSCNVGDPDLVTVRNMVTHLKHTDLGEPQTFEIDASAAGSGNLEILINGGRVSCKVRELGNRLYLATFVPVHPITHVIEMRFNGEPVKGSPWRIEVTLPSGSADTTQTTTSTMMTAIGAPPGFPLGSVILAAPIQLPGGTSPGNYAAYLTAPPNFATPNPTGGSTMTSFSEIERVTEDIGSTRLGATGGPMWAEIQGRGLTMASVGKVSNFEIGGRGLNVDDIEVRISGPNGKETPARVIAARTGNFRCEYVTTDVGTYRIDLILAGQPVTGSPFYVSSYAPQRVFIDPIPGGAVGQPVQFFVDANEAGKGQLEISINQGRVPNNVQMQGTGRCLVTFIPDHVGTFVIDVTFNGELVRGCPIRVEIYDQDATSGLSEQRQIVTDSSSARFIGRPRSPARAYSPGASQGAGVFGTTTYQYEKREYSSSGQTPSNEGGIHTSSVSYYIPGQPVTVQLPPTTTAITSTVISTSSTVPPAPPPPPPAQPIGSKILTKSWQQKSTPTETPTATQLEKKFEIETKRFESEPSTETKHIFHSERGEKGEPTYHRNGSAVQDRGATADEHGRVVQTTTTTTYRPRVTESTSVVESRHEEEYTVTRSHHRSPPDTHQERSREFDEIQRPATDRFYKFESDQPAQTTAYKYEEHSGRNRKDQEKFDDRPYDFEERLRRFEGKREDDRSLGRKYEQEEERFGAKKYFERQQTPLSQTKSSEFSDTPSTLRSEFEEKVARKSRNEREEKFTGSSASDLSRSGVTTVASYGTHSTGTPVITTSVSGYRRSSQTDSPITTHVLKPEQELVQSPMTELDTGRESYQRSVYSAMEKESRIRADREDERHKSDIQQRAAELKSEIRDIPIARTDKHVSREIQDTGGLKHTDTYEMELRRRDELRASPEAYSGSSADELDLSYERRKVESDTLRHVGGVTKEVKLDAGVIRVEFPEATDVGAGVVVVRVRKQNYFEVKPAIFDKNDLKVNIISPSKTNLDHRIRESRQGLIVEFTPLEVGTHKVHLQIRDETLLQSPYVVKVYDADRIQVTGIESGIVGNPVQFTVDATNAGYGSLEIAIKDSDGNIIPSKVNAMPDSTSKFTVSFLPQKADNYGIHVTFNQENLKGSPFVTSVKENTGIRDTSAISSPAASTIASQMTSEIMHQATHTPPIQTQTQTQTQLQSQTLTSSMQQSTVQTQAALTQATNGVTKTHSSTSLTGATTATPTALGSATATAGVVASAGAKLVGEDRTREKLLKLAPVGKTATILVTDAETKFGKPKVEVKGPNGKNLHAQVVDIGQGTFRIEFGPSMVGDHTVDVKLGDMHVQGSPFTCRVYDSRKIKVGEIPDGSVGKPVHFVVDAGEAGVGNLEVAVNEGRVQSMANGLGHHRYDISFVPKEPIEHTISVRFNNEAVPGSPFICKVASGGPAVASGPGIERVAVRKPTHFIVDASGHGNLQVTVKDPKGHEVPVSVSGSVEKSFRVEYTPQIVGNHSIDIRYGDVPVQNNPFIVKAYDSTQVRLLPVEGNMVDKTCSFQIDAAKAGAGNMEIIVSVDGKNVPNYVTPEGNAKFTVSFTPKEAREHLVSVKFNGESVPGSPMTANIVDDQAFSVIGDGLKQAIVGKPASFVVQAGEGAENDCNVVITAPDGGAVPVKCFQQKDGNFRVEYTPSQIGTHRIDITFGDQPITGSPYTCEVFDPSRVAIQTETHGLTLNQRVAVRVNKKAAGNANLTARVTDPNGKQVPVEVVPVSHNEDEIRFTPATPGQHQISVSYGGHDLTSIPVPVVLKADEPGMPSAYGDGLSRALVNEQASFVVDVKKLKGELKVDVIDQNGQSAKHLVRKKGDGLYETVFTPTEPGRYTVTLLWNNKPLTGSPFSVSVLNPSKIRIAGASSDRQESVPIRVGVEKEIKIDTIAAGPGKLRAEVRGPSGKLQTKLDEITSGQYRLAFTPMQEGEHSTYLYWSDLPVPSCPAIYWAERGAGVESAVLVETTKSKESKKQKKEGTESPSIGREGRGSPFALNVSSPPDPSKVRVYGPGVEHGILSKFKSDFSVDTQGAGAGQLTVRVRGPKAAFNVEMIRESKTDRLIRCKYEPKEPGDYQIEVKWAGEHVPGSPFLVMIFDTQQELERFLSGQPVTPAPPLPFLPPGWVGPPPPGLMLPSPTSAPPPMLMMPPSPVVGYRPPPRGITYGNGPPPFPVFAGGSPRHQNGF